MGLFSNDFASGPAYTGLQFVSVPSVQALTECDSIVVDDVAKVVWSVQVKDSTSGNVEAYEVHATHDGTAAGDATTVDYQIFGQLEITPVAGLNNTVDLSGTGAAQKLRLLISCDNTSDVSITRKEVPFN